jgi:hypothetical protein
MPLSLADSYTRTHPQTIAARRQQRQRWIQIRARRLGRQCPELAQHPAILARLAKTPLCPAHAERLVHTMAPGPQRDTHFYPRPFDFHSHGGRSMFTTDGRTSAAMIIRAFRFFKKHPEAQLQTGVWSDPVWTRDAFLHWFHDCLLQKINRGDTRPWRCLTPQWQADMAHDARLINDAARHIRWSGRNLLRTPEMRRRYPHVNTCWPDA